MSVFCLYRDIVIDFTYLDIAAYLIYDRNKKTCPKGWKYGAHFT